MAKKKSDKGSSPKVYNVGTHDAKHRQQLVKRAQRVRKLYESAVAKVMAAAAKPIAKADEGAEFRWKDFPALDKATDALLTQLGNGLSLNIEEAMDDAWTLSTAKNDAMVDALVASTAISKATLDKWKHPHLDALRTLKNRILGGMNLSDGTGDNTGVWNLGQFKEELELALQTMMGKGMSAAEMTKAVKQYLKYPDKLFRRVRDEYGNLRLSKAAKAFHPGQGVYRSSYKNALRLTATENNIAYRTNDYLRWQQMDFVIGIEIRLSNNHTCVGVKNFHDICDELAGRYPKDFKFVGWHPFCRCYAVSILCSDEEFDRYTKAIENGEDVSDWEFMGEVTEMPDNFNEWMVDNAERVARSKSLPYFIKDNPAYAGGAQVAYNAQKGIDNGIGRPSKSYIDTRNTIRQLQRVSAMFPDMVSGGIKELSVIRNNDEGYFAIGRLPNGGYSLKMANYNFAVISPKGKKLYYNPAKELNGAFQAIRNHKTLTFNQEYALEGLWHEMCHANAIGWKTVGVHDDGQRLLMETLNQFTARHSYDKMLAQLGISARHKTDVINHGYGYSNSVNNLARMIEKSPYSATEFATDMDSIFKTTHYEDLRDAVTKHLVNKGLDWCSGALSKIKRNKSVFEQYLRAMGV